jgi:hypothetical protein
MGTACSKNRGRKGAYKVLEGKPERRTTLRRQRSKWDDNIEMDLREMGWGMNWTDLAQDRNRWRALVNAVMNLRDPQNAGNSLSS